MAKKLDNKPKAKRKFNRIALNGSDKAYKTYKKVPKLDTIVFEAICVAIEEGCSLNKVIKEMGIFCGDFYRLVDSTPVFTDRYKLARQKQCDYYAQEICDISDTEPDPAVARVRMDARKWFASKVAPKSYGDKTILSGDSENPIQVQNGLSPELLSRIDKLIGNDNDED